MDPQVLPGWEAGGGVGSAEQGKERGAQRKEENRKEDQQGERRIYTHSHTCFTRTRGPAGLDSHSETTSKSTLWSKGRRQGPGTLPLTLS